MADGKELNRRLQELLNEDSDSGWLDKRTSFDLFYEGAVEFVSRTHCLKGTQTITTVADQTDYNLNPDFLKMFLKNKNGDYIIKWGDCDFITWKDHNDIIYGNQSDSVSMSDSFTITNADLPTQLTGTTTSVGAATAGLSTLTDTTADFTDVAEGGTVHNTSDGSTGIITSKTSSTVLKTALFGGTANDWTSGDAYVIQPQGRMKMILDPPPDDTNTITFDYIKNPAPVYSDYQVYEFLSKYSPALVKYAFWLYKYRDSEPNFGDGMYRYWDNAVREAGFGTNQALNRQIKVSFKS